MESLIGLVNKIQRACTVLGDHGGEGMSLWEALPSVAVVGGQVTAIPRLLAAFPLVDLRCGRFGESDAEPFFVVVCLLGFLELRKIFGARERGGEGFPASWIW